VVGYFGWLVGWLVGWLAGWLAKLISCLVGWAWLGYLLGGYYHFRLVDSDV